MQDTQYGTQDASFRAAGGEEGLRRLVDAFYDEMQRLAEARRILEMHPADLEESRDKLSRFLCGWLGGPRRYQERYGSITLPSAHGHLDIGESERDAWLRCMFLAVEAQPYTEDFKEYLLKQLFVPAERIRRVCADRLGSREGSGA